MGIIASETEENNARLWDKQIADDLDAGRLDGLLQEVEQEIEADSATPV